LKVFTPDPDTNRQSIKKIAALKPRVGCFGHGPVMRDTPRSVEFAKRL